jgi:hypothetical protein
MPPGEGKALRHKIKRGIKHTMSSALDEYFGPREKPTIEEIKATSTRTMFPHTPAGAREYADEFLAVMRELTEKPDYLPGPTLKRNIASGAVDLFNEVGFFDRGFLSWAMRKMRAEGVIIKSPRSCIYLVPYYREKRGKDLDTQEGRNRYLVGIEESE